VFQQTAMISMLKNPPEEFQEAIEEHFRSKKHTILQQCERWEKDMAKASSQGRHHSFHCLQLPSPSQFQQVSHALKELLKSKFP